MIREDGHRYACFVLRCLRYTCDGHPREYTNVLRIWAIADGELTYPMVSIVKSSVASQEAYDLPVEGHGVNNCVHQRLTEACYPNGRQCNRHLQYRLQCTAVIAPPQLHM